MSSLCDAEAVRDGRPRAGRVRRRLPGAGGAGRIYYVGTSLERGWDCTMCHVDPPEKIGLRVDVDPPRLFETFRYEPENAYRFTVHLENEHRGLRAGRSNFNALALAFANADGIYQGSLGGFDASAFFDGNGTIASSGTRVGATEWTAPEAGAGSVTLYLGAVDGSGANSDANTTRTDPFGDDVAMTQIHFEAWLLTAFAMVPLLGATAHRRNSKVHGAGQLRLPSFHSGDHHDSGYCLALAVAFLGTVAGSTSGCGDDDCENTGGGDPCPGGICGSGANGSESNGTGANSGSGGTTGCRPAWVCSPWHTMGNGTMSTRTCIDTNDCDNDTGRPKGGTTLPALDENYDRCNVEPITDKYCSQLGCHGREPNLANGDPGSTAKARLSWKPRRLNS